MENTTVTVLSLAEMKLKNYWGYFLVALIVPPILATFTINIIGEYVISTPEKLDSRGLVSMLFHSLFSSIFLMIIAFEINKFDKHFIPLTSTKIRTVVLYGGLVFCLAKMIMYSIDFLGLETSQFFNGIVNSNLELTLGFIVICLLAPVFEEILYRGILFRALTKSSLSAFTTILASSTVFTAIHLQYGIVDLTVVFMFGLFFGWVRYKTNSLITPIVCHALINTTSYIQIVFS